MKMSDLKNVPTEFQKALTDFAKDNNVSMREMAQLCNMIAIKESILQQHKSPITQNAKNGRWFTRLPNGKQIAKTKREDLENAIIEYYAEQPEIRKQLIQIGMLPSQETPVMAEHSKSTVTRTLKTIYPEWLENRKYEVSPNTLADDLDYWKQHIMTSDIADLPLQELSKAQLKKWACKLIVDNNMKKRYFANVKGTLNSLLDFAMDEELLDVNYLQCIKINQHLYKPATFKEENEEVFTEQEQEQVMNEAEKDSQEHDSAIPLGICILFLTGLRVGELCALRNCDIMDDHLCVRRMVVEKQVENSDGGLTRNGYQIVEHAKSSASIRDIYLTTKAREYFKQIKRLNKMNNYPCSDHDLVFQRKEGMCNQRVFDSRLKKYCNPKHLNLPFAKSCHDIRRTFISQLCSLKDDKMNFDTIRRIAGHENIEMTMKYCRSRTSQEEVAEIMERNL